MFKMMALATVLALDSSGPQMPADYIQLRKHLLLPRPQKNMFTGRPAFCVTRRSHTTGQAIVLLRQAVTTDPGDYDASWRLAKLLRS